ncbi:MAG: YciI family protein [Verrucomicrobiota bacterium]
MSNQPQSGYLLVFRSTDWYKGLSQAQIQEIADHWMAWFRRLSEEGTVVAGNPLEHTGKVVSGKGGGLVADGPFVESKETIGGYFLLKTTSLAEALAIAQQCPGLPYGIRIEVRPIAGECPVGEEGRNATV